MDTIFTLDARENSMLEVMADYFELSHSQVFHEIGGMFQMLKNQLSAKDVKYEDLKSCLVPNPKRNEVVLVFDTQKISSYWYGYPIFEKLIPLFNKGSSHSVLCGDYIDKIHNPDRLYEEFSRSITLVRNCDYVHGSQFYLVYLNNVSNKMLAGFNDGLVDFEPYVGFMDLTYSSFIKTYVSMILCNVFVKSKNTIIMGHEDDRDESENVNICGYPFEENGYRYVSVSDSLFSVFLSYKIEREVFDGFKNDTVFSINAVSRNVLAIDDFDVLIEENKLIYLRKNKGEKLKKAGLINLDSGELEYLIRERISSNYIYNMVHLTEYNTTKFNLLVEVQAEDTG
ncbi:MAG: hypothetical protein NTX52_08600, partial [Planctomycetota bacterium]|nr:hypothetical protein [Planctomycetota bacterium]